MLPTPAASYLAPSAETLYRSVRWLHAPAALAAVALALFLWPQVEPGPLLSWLILMLTCIAARGAAVLLYRDRRLHPVWPHWASLFVSLHLLAAALWGGSALLFGPNLALWQLVMVATFLLCVVALSVAPLRSVPWLIAGGATLTLVPAVIQLLLSAAQEPWATAFAALIAAAGVTFAVSGFIHRPEPLHLDELGVRGGSSVDPLTGALSYSGFAAALAERLRQRERLLVVCIDIDGFKRINDAIGMHRGDLILQQMAHKLIRFAGRSEFVGRNSADEFLLIAPLDQASDTAHEVARRLVESFSGPWGTEGEDLEVRVSAGIAVFPDHGTDRAVLIQRAILAMRAAKGQSQNSYRVYDSLLTAVARDKFSLHTELGQALKRGEFQLYYQPKIDLPTGRIVGAEALLRWRSARLGHVPPSEFVPLAEQWGLVVPIGDWVIEEAAAAAARLRELGPIQIALNVSLHQFYAGGLPRRLGSAIKRYGIEPDMLQLEVTETVFMREPQVVQHALSIIRALGITVALDDFGTGYSSLAYLRQMNIDFLKLDQSFLSAVPNDRRQSAIVESIIVLAKALGIGVVAEGIEAEHQLQWLTQVGCRYGQGFLLGGPMTERDFRSFLETRAAVPADAPVH
jgi:diguanylate cyclase (GGDEF)-like protein